MAKDEQLFTPASNEDLRMTPWREKIPPPKDFPKDPMQQLVDVLESPIPRFFGNAGEFLIDTVHGISRSGGSVGMQMLKGFTGKDTLEPDEGGRLQRAFHYSVFGDEPVESLERRIEKLPERVKEIGIGIEGPWVQKYSPLIIGGLTVGDLTGLGSGKKKVFQESVEFIAKTDDVASIAFHLKRFLPKTSDTVVDALSKQLRSASNPKMVQNTIEEFFKFDEWVKGQGTSVFRGGEPLNQLKITDELGISVSKSKKTADFFSKTKKGGVTEALVVSPEARVLRFENIPQTIKNSFTKIDTNLPIAEQVREAPVLLKKAEKELVKYAKDNNYDVIDMSGFDIKGKLAIDSEKELRILNTDILKTRSQLKAKWNKAKKEAGTVGDLTGLGSGKKKVFQESVEFIAKTDDVASIAFHLKRFLPKTSDTVVDALSKQLRSASNPKMVQNTIEEFFKKGDHVESVVNKLRGKLQSFRSVRKETEELYSEEWTQRFARAEKAMDSAEGMARFDAAKKELAGSLPKAKLNPIKLDQSDVDILGNAIHGAEHLSIGEKITAAEGLNKALGLDPKGFVPTTGELDLLADVFGRDLVQDIMKSRGIRDKLGKIVLETVNAPKTLMSSADMSAPFRQGIVAITSHPIISAKAFPKMFRYWKNSETFLDGMRAIQRRNTYGLMKKSNLELTKSFGSTISLTKKEEAFMSNYVERVWGVGNVVRASERAYVGFLNQIRADLFDNLAKGLMNKGHHFSKDPKLFQDLAKFVNNATGRGNFPGDKLSRIPYLNSWFFSPKLIASRVNLITLFAGQKMHPKIRKQVVKDMLKFYGTMATVLGAFKMAGHDVETDMRSSDFAKIKKGNTRYDISGGFQPYFRIFAQILTGEKKSTRTGRITDLRETTNGEFQIRKDALQGAYFATGKFAPVPSFFLDFILDRTDFGDREGFEAKKALANRLWPLFFQDVSEAAEELGWIKASTQVGIPAFFGVGTQTFDSGGGVKADSRTRR